MLMKVLAEEGEHPLPCVACFHATPKVKSVRYTN
jgi:hypothetical protein